MALSIAVCAKPVPDLEYYNKITIDPVKKTITREGIPTIINPVDKNALEAALQLKQKYGGKVAIFSMAPPSASEELRGLLAMGGDEAYLLSDRAFAGADTLATSYTLSRGISKAGDFDIVLCGSESADGATSQVPPQLGEWLGYSHLANVFSIEALEEKKFYLKSKAEDGYMEWEAEAPLVVSVSRDINKPRYTTIKGIMMSKKKRLEILGLKDLDLDENIIGLAGSPTKPGNIYTLNLKRKGEKIEGSTEEVIDMIISKLRAAGTSLGVQRVGDSCERGRRHE